MKIDKAIEILGIFRDEGEVDLPPDVDPAITLGSEALKRLELMRQVGIDLSEDILPGEDTEENAPS